MSVVFGREGARWEWRIFSEQEDFYDLFEGMEPQQQIESHEVYFLREGSDANVKIRWGRLEIKRLAGVNRNGLEHWQLEMRENFKLTPGNIEQLYAAWGVDGPAVREKLDETKFAELMGKIGGVNALRVHKQRQGYALLGGTAERAKIEIEGSRYFTASIEHTDEAQAWAMVQELGIQRRENVNYVRGLKMLRGIE